MHAIRRLSRTENDTFVNDVVWRSLGDVLKYITGDEINTLVLMQIMVSRDEGTAMHSAMVEQIARRILNVVMKKRPELLIGTFGYENVVEVLENRGDDSGLCFPVCTASGYWNDQTCIYCEQAVTAADTKGKEWYFQPSL